MTLEQRLSALITQLGADHKAQQTSISNLTTAIGSLPGLNTTNKTNLVLAINKVFALASTGTGIINDSLTISTSKTYSIDKIKLEIGALKSELLGGIPAATFDTLKEISDYILADQSAGAAMATQIGNRVSYTSSDNRTLEEKQQTRTNILSQGTTENYRFNFIPNTTYYTTLTVSGKDILKAIIPTNIGITEVDFFSTSLLNAINNKISLLPSTIWNNSTKKITDIE